VLFEISLEERKAADGQSFLIGLAVGDQALEVGFKRGELSFKIVCDPHEVAG
jgi:hypothetical protein